MAAAGPRESKIWIIGHFSVRPFKVTAADVGTLIRL
jgi:hypothetical protein